MVQTPIKPTSLAEFLSLPETKPACEYVDGNIAHKPIPKGRHSIIQAELSATLNATLRRGGIATAFPDLTCTFGECSIVPDIAVFEDSRIPRIENGEVAIFLSQRQIGLLRSFHPSKALPGFSRKLPTALPTERKWDGWLPQMITPLSFISPVEI
jgi:hypothetical protein